MVTFLNDALTPNEWNRRRTLQVSGGDPNGGVALEGLVRPLSDLMPVGQWQHLRSAQVNGAGAGVGANGAQTPRSARQWEVEDAQAAGRSLREAGESAGRVIGSLFGKPEPKPSAPTKAAATPPAARFSKGQAARELGAGVVLDRIGIGEHAGRPVSYDTTFGYGAFVPEGSKRVTEMTLDEVAALQDGMLAQQKGRRGIPSSSVGKYQFNTGTLRDLRERLNLDGTEILTPELQDRLARELLDQKGYGDFISGKMDARTFQGRLAPIWPSVARVATGTAPAGQHLGTTTAEMQAALDQAKAEADHMVSSFSLDPYEKGWR